MSYIIGIELVAYIAPIFVSHTTPVARPFMGLERLTVIMRGLKNIRLPEYDYRTDGYYFVTIVSRRRNNIFKGKEGLIEQFLESTLHGIKGVSVDTKIIMPNHIHLILVLQDCAVPLGEIVRRYKATVSKNFGYSPWQPNYYEHVIRNEHALNRIREYILLNPDLELLKIERFYKK